MLGLRGLRRALRSLVLPLAVLGVLVTVTLGLEHLGEREVHAQRDLQTVVAELHAQDSWEFQALGGRLAPAGVRPELLRSRQAVRALLRDPALDRYAAAVDEELRLLAAGRRADAEEFHEQQVDPAFRGAVAAVGQRSRVVSARSAQAQRAGDAGVLLTVLLSLVGTAWWQDRRSRDEGRISAERRAEARYRSLVDQSADLVVVCDRAGEVGYASPSARRAFGRRQGPGFPNLLAHAHEDSRAALAGALAQAAPGAVVRLDVQGWFDAQLRTIELSVQDLTADPAVGGLVLTGHDVTERRRLQQQVEHRARHDALTGLPNRALLADRFAQALEAGRAAGSTTAFLLIDLDRFKEVNDTLGHHCGDDLLTQVGARLTGAVRGTDTLARLGGDEFAVLLPGVDGLTDAVIVAHDLQGVLAQPFTVDGIVLDVEASVGVAVSGEHGDDPVALMQRADIAMYVAKQRGLGVAVYDPQEDAHSPQRLALLGDLRRALAGDELVLHYQPKVDLTSGEVCSVEALVRWQHPERGLVPPDDFIPLAENSGLIGPLTTRVLDLALDQARRWADAGAPLRVAVNLSARSLLDERVPPAVLDALRRHGVGAELLTLEVTESAIVLDPARARATLGRLAALGVTLSIDDFGVGYTSLGQLKDLPVTELKVDRSFVSTLCTDASNATIVRSVVDLGHHLGLSIVAEGVEDAATLDALVGWSCDAAQGYHLSRPLPVEAFDRWRAQWSGPLAPTVRA